MYDSGAPWHTPRLTRRAGDGCQRPLVPRFRCQPRLTPSVGVCRDKPARCAGVQVANSEGRANHAGAASCARLGKGVREAVTGEGAGRGVRPAIGQSGCRRAPNTRKATAGPPLGHGGPAPGGVAAHMHQAKLVCLMECLHPPGNDPCSGPRRQAIGDSFCGFFFVCTAF